LICANCLSDNLNLNLFNKHAMMSTDTIRERLHEYIRFADDKKVNAIYTMVEDEIVDRLDLRDDPAFLNELKERLDDIESGNDEGLSWEEVKLKARSRVHEKRDQPSRNDKVDLMKQALNDPLFLADLKEVTDDFGVVDSEHI
jgi:hypothetical protein